MNANTTMKGALLALCIIGMLVLPAAAAGQATTGQASAIDQGLRDDLWASHHTYRLQEFDSHVAQANNVIGILGKYSIDTTQMQATLTTISGRARNMNHRPIISERLKCAISLDFLFDGFAKQAGRAQDENQD